jgi:hypothetical protein
MQSELVTELGDASPITLPDPARCFILTLWAWEGQRGRGALYHPYFQSPYFFDCLDQAILAMDAVIGQSACPQAAESGAADAGHAGSQGWKSHAAVSDWRPSSSYAPQKGKACFVIHILRREYATWQGEVIWRSAHKKAHFRSVLELLFLLQSACSAPVPTHDAPLQKP